MLDWNLQIKTILPHKRYYKYDGQWELVGCTGSYTISELINLTFFV